MDQNSSNRAEGNKKAEREAEERADAEKERGEEAPIRALEEKETHGEALNTAYLVSIGVGEEKSKELLKNKRIRGVVDGLMRISKEKRPEEMTEQQKKLAYKIVERAETEKEAETYMGLVLEEAAKDETDIKNIGSIIARRPNADAEEIKEQMRKNVPTHEELVRVAAGIVEENAGEAKAKILKELKHHPRLEFVSPKAILELLETLSVEMPSARKSEKKETLKEMVEELLKMSEMKQPPTRTINRTYQRLVVPEELMSSKERKWTRFKEGEMQTMHTPFTNYQKNAEILRQHIERTGGQVRVRFPPEPNGHLHIGHAKALSINFGYREFYRGWISLRYDDTNPKAEKTEYYERIKEMVEWMGYVPDAVTNASDYFPRLYECAVELIRRGKAYVCHMSREDVSEKRKETMQSRIDSTQEKAHSPWRDRPVEENLKEFEKMRNGEHNEGEAVLRMKMDMDSDNPQLWDLVAYRVVKHPHPRTGSAWVIYPSYDFTHCLTDSFEDITHSFCTTEFINSRESYNWLCDALDLYRPVQWEYSRLCISNALLSKRYITKEIREGAFSGWDDPRLSTLEGLRSRGVPAHSIRRFVESLGITTAASEISENVLDGIIREDLSESPKTFAVLDPIRMRILGDANLAEREVLIDRKDYRTGERDPSFYRLQKDTAVQLKEIGAVEIAEDEGAGEEEVVVRRTDKQPGASVVSWAEISSVPVVLEVIRGREILTYRNARVSEAAVRSKPGTYWQFTRAGFFIRMDTDEVRFRMVVALKAAPLLE